MLDLVYAKTPFNETLSLLGISFHVASGNAAAGNSCLTGNSHFPAPSIRGDGEIRGRLIADGEGKRAVGNDFRQDREHLLPDLGGQVQVLQTTQNLRDVIAGFRVESNRGNILFAELQLGSDDLAHEF